MGLLTGKVDPIANIPQYNSGFEEWINWYDALKQNFGKKNAKQLWIKAWKIRGNSKANTNELRTYMAKHDITIDKTTWDSVIDTAVNATDIFGDTFTVGRYLGIGVAIIIVGGLGLAIFNIAKKPAESIGTAIKYAK
jgi:hypothetical protein